MLDILTKWPHYHCLTEHELGRQSQGECAGCDPKPINSTWGNRQIWNIFIASLICARAQNELMPVIFKSHSRFRRTLTSDIHGPIHSRIIDAETQVGSNHNRVIQKLYLWIAGRTATGRLRRVTNANETNSEMTEPRLGGRATLSDKYSYWVKEFEYYCSMPGSSNICSKEVHVAFAAWVVYIVYAHKTRASNLDVNLLVFTTIS